jgi:glycosyltransferase involved in cell wall biosynthesis
MKILYLLTQDLESPSGLGRYWPIAREMAAKGHEVRIAALHSRWDALLEKEFMRDGVTVTYVAPMHVRKSGNQKQYYSATLLPLVAFQATWALSRAALTGVVDIIHVGKPHPMNSIAGLIASKIKGSILWVDCDDFEAGSNHFNQPWQKSIVAAFEKNIPRYARMVTTNTYFMRDNLISWGCPPGKIIYLPNGIDEQRLSLINEDDVRQLRMRLALDGKDVVLYAGSLSLANHPVDLLIEAIVKVSHQRPNVVLLIVGGGEDYQKLIEYAKASGIGDITRLTGRVAPEDIPTYYHLAAVSVDPVHDNDAARGRSPLKLFESWAWGVPFITSPVGDREHLLHEPPAGVLINPAGDPDALAEGILSVLSSVDFACQLRERGLKRARQFMWSKLVDQLEKEYLKFL